MSFQFNRFEATAGIEPERALNISMGVAQAPLWAAFYATAGLGAAWWWSTAWSRSLPGFDVARLLAPEPTPPAEAYIEALDGAVCDLIETSQEEAAQAVEVVEAIQDSAEFAQEATSEAVADAAEAVIEAFPEPLIETTAEEVEAAAQPLIETPATEAAVEPLAFASADPEAPVAELVTLEPEAEAPAADKPAFKPSKKKPRPQG